jgi:hypothetical protein
MLPEVIAGTPEEATGTAAITLAIAKLYAPCRMGGDVLGVARVVGEHTC